MISVCCTGASALASTEFITSYARCWIVRSAQVFGDDFVYADTDSIHTINAEKWESGLQVHPTKLGLWKKESVSEKGRYVGPKKYVHVNENKKGKVKPLEVTCAGMPDDCKKLVTWENFKKGAKYEGKLAGKFVAGGYVLSETTFNINV